MPYASRKGDSGKWEVFNTDTDEVKVEHEDPDAEQKANRQVKLLNEIESDPAWDEEEKSDG